LTTELLVRDRQELKLDEVQRQVPVLAQVLVLVPQPVREQVQQLAQAQLRLLALQAEQPVHCGRCSRVRLRE
jgi:hypothetical protein